MDSQLQKYQVFLETVRLGSFTKAAEELGYTQSGVSRIIADLEHSWGLVLLERSRGGVNLTSDGVELMPYIRDLYSRYESLSTKVESLKGMESGTIRLGVIASIATHWLPPVIKRFREDYPNIEFDLEIGGYTEIADWVADGSVDCGFLRKPDNTDLDTLTLGLDEFMVLLPTDHPLAGCGSFPKKALEEYPLLAIEKQGDNETEEILLELGVKYNPKVTTWDDYSVMAMVESGIGIGIMPTLMLKRQTYDIAIKHLDEPAYRELVLAMRKRTRMSVAAEMFVEYIEDSELADTELGF